MTDQEFIQKLPAVDKYYVIFCEFTKMPYVECDLKTYDDQAFIFFELEKAKQFVDAYAEDKMILSVRQYERTNIKNFFSELIAMGINMVCFRSDRIYNISIEELVTRSFPEGVQPVENPTLQISMMYFMQAVRTAETKEEQMIARQYEEEMMVNLARARYLVPSKEVGEEDEQGNQKVSFLQMKNQNGDAFIPLFTDVNEFAKANPQEGTTRFMIFGFDKIKKMKFPGMSGFIVNPGTTALLLNEQHIKVVDERFGDQAVDAEPEEEKQ